MATLFLLAMMMQAAPAPIEAIVECDLLAVPLICDAPQLRTTHPSTDKSGSPALCRGSFVENCRRHAMSFCGMMVREVSATVNGSSASCNFTCANQSLTERETCELPGSNTMAACIFPACPPGCLSCVDLGGKQCRRELVDGAPDKSKRSKSTRARHGLIRGAPGARWVCE